MAARDATVLDHHGFNIPFPPPANFPRPLYFEHRSLIRRKRLQGEQSTVGLRASFPVNWLASIYLRFRVCPQLAPQRPNSNLMNLTFFSFRRLVVPVSPSLLACLPACISASLPFPPLSPISLRATGTGSRLDAFVHMPKCLVGLIVYWVCISCLDFIFSHNPKHHRRAHAPLMRKHTCAVL